MTPALRPMNLGEILDRTFQIYRSRFLTFVGIGLASPMATLAIFALVEYGPQPILTASTKATIKEIFLWVPTDWPATSARFLAWPIIAYLTSRAVCGEDSSLGNAWFQCKMRWKSWLAIAGILWAICELLPNAVLRVAIESGIQSMLARRLASTGIRFLSSQTLPFFELFQWVAGYLLVAAFSLSIPVWTIEPVAVSDALLRGWTLAKGRWFRLLSARFLADSLGWTLTLSLILMALIPIRLGLRSYTGLGVIYQIRSGIVLVATQAASVLVAAIYPIAITLFYYDQRIRREGYDIERMMDAAGLNPIATPLADLPVPEPAAQEGQA